MKKIELSIEFATDIGLIPSCLDHAFRSVEGCSILSRATDRSFESSYLAELNRVYRNFNVDTKNLTVEVLEEDLIKFLK